MDAETRRAWVTRLELDGKIKVPILQALVDADIKKALQLLESGNVSKKDIRTGDIKLPTGLTALHLAALFGDEIIVEKLLERHADTNVTIYCQIASHSVATKYWMDARPLLLAIGAKHHTVIKMLLDAGASVEMQDAWPLYSSEWLRFTDRFDWTETRSILQTLQKHGLDINDRVAKQRWSMLHYCVNLEPRDWSAAEPFMEQRYETVDFLLQNGADPLLKDTFGRTAYEIVNERVENASRHPQNDDARAEIDHLRVDADKRLQELLQQGMARRLDFLKSQRGLRGTLQRFVVTSQALDRIPLLRSAATSMRRSSMSSFGGESQLTDRTIRS